MALSDWDPTASARPDTYKAGQYQGQTYTAAKPTASGADLIALKKAMGITDPVDYRQSQIAAGTNTINQQATGVKGASDQNYASRGNYRGAAAANAQDRINQAVSGQKVQLAADTERSYANDQQNAAMRDLQMALGLNQQANQIGLANVNSQNQIGMYNTGAANDANRFNIGNKFAADQAKKNQLMDIMGGAIGLGGDLGVAAIMDD